MQFQTIDRSPLIKEHIASASLLLASAAASAAKGNIGDTQDAISRSMQHLQFATGCCGGMIACVAEGYEIVAGKARADAEIATRSEPITVDGPPGFGPRTVIMGNWQDVPAAA